TSKSRQLRLVNAVRIPTAPFQFARLRAEYSKWKIPERDRGVRTVPDRKSTRLNSSHSQISYAVFCLKKKKKKNKNTKLPNHVNKKERRRDNKLKHLDAVRT